MHDADHVADGKGLELVVCHQERGGARGFQNAAHLVGQAFAQVHVQVGKRLVEQQEPWLRGQGARQGHALLLPAREFVGVARLHALQAHQGQDLVHPCGARGARQVFNAKTHVAPDVEVGEEGVVLEDHADAALFCRDVVVGAADHFFAQHHLPAAGSLQARHRTQQGGFAAARWADEHPNVAGFQPQTHAIDGRALGAGVAHAEVGEVQEHGLIVDKYNSHLA